MPTLFEKTFAAFASLALFAISFGAVVNVPANTAFAPASSTIELA